jgi:hypothetical protein
VEDPKFPVGDGKLLVARGDCIISIADAKKMRVQDILNHPPNKSLKELRKDPSCLLPGDRIHVPSIPERTESAPTESREHKFEIKKPQVFIRVKILVNGKPVNEQNATKPVNEFRLEITTKTHSFEPKPTVTVDKGGFVMIEIPADAERVDLTWPVDPNPDDPDGVRLVFNLGTLAPIETDRGVLARLANLGYTVDVAAQLNDPLNIVGLRQFARVAGIQATQDDMSATRSKLKEQLDLALQKPHT